MFSTMLRTTALGAAAALGLGAFAQAQPYDNDNDYRDNTAGYSDNDVGYGASAYAGGLVVEAPGRHQERSVTGAPIVWARATRVVDMSDLDLSTRGGVRELRGRVERAASDACDSLNRLPGLVPMDDPSDVDCFHRAVDRAMAAAPINYAAYRY